jgi:hypothetical protein
MTRYLVERTQLIVIEDDDFDVADLEPGTDNAVFLAREIDEWETVNIDVEVQREQANLWDQ